MSRPSWVHHGLNKAWVESLRSTCRVKVGAAVTTPEHRSLVSGYAGSLPGEPHCTDVGCDWHWIAPNCVDFKPAAYGGPNDYPGTLKKHCKRTIHAEPNCFAIAAAEGIPLRGAIWYTVPFGPCDTCSKLLVASGASKVVYPAPPLGYEHYRDCPILIKAGVEVEIVTDWAPPC